MKSIKDINFKGKRVLLRVDFNVPLNENRQITDDTRIMESLPTIKKLVADGAKTILIAHLGRPKGFDEKYSLQPVADYLKPLLGKIHFLSELLDDKVLDMVNNLQEGEIMLLENIRFYSEETKGDEAFAQRLAKLGDCYINDAFGSSHRNHVSTCTLAKFFPDNKYFGFLMEYEVTNLKKLMQNPKKPFTSVIGGSKISSKINILKSLLSISNNILIGGGMVFTFLKAQGKHIGNSLCEDDCLEIANDFLRTAQEKGVKIYLPADIVIADRFANDADRLTVSADAIPDNRMGMDIGERSAVIFWEVLLQSKTILWNGPMGVFEMSNFAAGTKAIAEATAAATDRGAFSTVGGGDSVAAINMFNLGNRVSFVSTGGGAMLEYIENGTLPGIDAVIR
ncbi:MAG: phosphoglycerate kinase [Bacteroidales bacterium]|jgi:phosphoglycerate kinase|nr:phosphoglycerate kinase [Bacteroidales bacterium]